MARWKMDWQRLANIAGAPRTVGWVTYYPNSGSSSSGGSSSWGWSSSYNSSSQPSNTNTQPSNTRVQEWTAITDQYWNIVRPDLLAQPAYQDDSDSRQQQIINNLNQARQQNPASLTDANTFRQYYNYSWRSEQQKQILDNWYSGYSEGRTLAQQTARTLADQLGSGIISQAQLANLQVYDPEKYANTMKIYEQGAVLSWYNNQLNPQASENPFQWIIDNLTQNLSNFSQTPKIYDQYKEQINSPEMKELMNNINTRQTKIEEMDLDILNAQKSIEKRYEWSGITRGKLNSIINDEIFELSNARSNLAIQMNSAVNKYNSQMSTISQDLELQLQDYQLQQQAQTMQMQQIGMITNLMSYETPQQQSDRAFADLIRQQEYLEGNIYSNDPATRRRAVSNAVDNILQEFAGIPMIRSREQMIQDIQNMVDNGTDLGTALTKNLREPIMDKPEYKSWLQQKFWTWAPDIYSIWGMDMVRDSATWSFKSPSISWGWLNFINSNLWDLSQNAELMAAASQSQEASIKNNNPTGIKYNISNNLKNILAQNGIQYTKGSMSPEWWAYMKFATMDEGLRAYQVILTQASYDDVYARLKQRKTVGDVEWYAKWIMDRAWIPMWSKFSSLSPEQMNSLMSEHLKRESGLLYNYMASLGGGWVWGSWVWSSWVSDVISSGLFDETFQTYFEQWKKNTALGTEKDREKIFNDMWIDNYSDFMRLAGEWRAARPVDARTLQLLEALDRLEEWVRKWVGIQSSWITTNPDLKADYNFLKSNLTLESLQAAKARGATFGSMSDGERSILAQAATSLSPWLSKGRFESEIQNIRNQIYENYPSLAGGTSLSWWRSSQNMSLGMSMADWTTQYFTWTQPANQNNAYWFNFWWLF